jgi:hypothetical protein
MTCSDLRDCVGRQNMGPDCCCQVSSLVPGRLRAEPGTKTKVWEVNVQERGGVANESVETMVQKLLGISSQ